MQACSTDRQGQGLTTLNDAKIYCLQITCIIEAIIEADYIYFSYGARKAQFFNTESATSSEPDQTRSAHFKKNKTLSQFALMGQIITDISLGD